MHKTTVTLHASDVYQLFVDELLKEHPNYWTKDSRQKKRKREFIYRKRKEPTVETVMTFERFHKILQVYFTLAKKKVIEGKMLKLGHRLGVIRARTISRSFKNRKVDWVETKKQPLVIDPVTGKMKRAQVIYFDSDTYSRIAWEKMRRISNISLYKFVPSQGGKNSGGFKFEFKQALKNDPLLETRYKQFVNELSIS